MKVSIGIPVYNCELWIRRAIESALSQSWPDKEVIVVDDGSTDSTASICESFGDRIRFLKQTNRGGNVARNRILSESTGDWVQFLDADDYLEPEKISSQIAGHPDPKAIDVLCSATVEEYWVDNELSHRKTRLFGADPDWYALWLQWSMPQTGGCLWKRSALRQIGGWNEAFRCNQEYELYFRAFRHQLRFVASGQPGAIYRIWSDETVCRKDQRAVINGITELIEEFLAWLQASGKMQPAYQQQAGRNCFAMARTLANNNLRSAAAYYRARKKGGLICAAGSTAPLNYLLVLKWFGFTAAELLAKYSRKYRFQEKPLTANHQGA